MITSQQTTLYQRGKEKCSHQHSFTHPTPPHSVSPPVIVISHDVVIQGQFTKIVTSDVSTDVWRYKEFDWMDWTSDVNIWGQKLKICATRPCYKRSLFCWMACSREQERHDNKFSFCESVLLNKTRSLSFLGLSLVFNLVRFLLFTPKNETCFVLLSYDFCHEKDKRN